ncbi:CHAD domain-containing protein [Nitrogeniibacter mangrovi]|uniref:CHAD domain-containing protein n=1 Tax=Nitrogeniibacter mangrovi TaxID=2016596 RepID=A0A6C1B7V1_9RHOO|nr:CHAD domain-containing protein [Nitrogeniibacter mangrovi]QID18324.1 CHAD domain-containing protein [Nitrogeniibacter mangrovi]
MSKEIELKLALPKAALAALRRHDLVARSEKIGNAATLTNTYYDTPQLSLRARRIALRTRKQGRRWLQTVKCAAPSVGGLSARPEWEQDFLGAFDFSAIDDTGTAQELEAVADRLVPVFTTNFRRETYRLTPAEGVEILLMLDQGRIAAEGREEPICEAELELVSGNADDLFAVACALAEHVQLMPSDRSKAQRGYALFTATPAEAARADKSRIEPGQSPLEAFRTLAHDCLRQWQANAAAAIDGDDPEYVHQMRVALRRLRSLVRLFRPALPESFVDHWSDVLRDTASEMGDARDFDVMLAEILDVAEPAPLMPATLLDGLREQALSAREAARRDARERLTHSSQGLRILRFARELNALGSNALDASADLTAFARLQMDALRKRSRKRFALAQGPDPDHIHELRVALKQVRYGAEFFQPLFAGDTMKPFLGALRRAQEQLGYLNDVEIARGRMLGWVETHPELAAPTHFVLGWHAPRCARIRRRILLEVEPLLWGKSAWKRPRKSP